jgi:hypothetical protein
MEIYIAFEYKGDSFNFPGALPKNMTSPVLEERFQYAATTEELIISKWYEPIASQEGFKEIAQYRTNHLNQGEALLLVGEWHDKRVYTLIRKQLVTEQ